MDKKNAKTQNRLRERLSFDVEVPGEVNIAAQRNICISMGRNSFQGALLMDKINANRLCIFWRVCAPLVARSLKCDHWVASHRGVV